MVKSAAAVKIVFTVCDPGTGAAIDADSLPTGTLHVDGVDNAAAVTIANGGTGYYTAAVTLPALTAGQIVGVRVTATVAGIAGQGIVWQDTADTAVPSDVLAEVMMALRILRNKLITDPVAGTLTVYDDAGTAALLQADIFEDAAGSVPYAGGGVERRERMV